MLANSEIDGTTSSIEHQMNFLATKNSCCPAVHLEGDSSIAEMMSCAGYCYHSIKQNCASFLEQLPPSVTETWYNQSVLRLWTLFPDLDRLQKQISLSPNAARIHWLRQFCSVSFHKHLFDYDSAIYKVILHVTFFPVSANTFVLKGPEVWAFIV